MPSTLLQSQFDTLEAPTSGIICDASLQKDRLLQHIMNTIIAQDTSQLGLIGLGVMGKSLSRNFANNDIKMSLFNRHVLGVEEDIAVRTSLAMDNFKKAKSFKQMLYSPYFGSFMFDSDSFEIDERIYKRFF